MMKAKLKNFWKHLLVWLRVEVPADGLEVSDYGIRWCRTHRGAPENVVVPLTTGIIKDGKILDRPAFLAALQQVRGGILGKRAAGKANIMVTLSFDSIPTSMRLFSLPWIERDRLTNAVALNLKMAMPGSESETVAGWRIVEKDQARGNILVSALFAEKELLDDMVDALREARFLTVAAEPKAVSLARAIGQGQAVNTDPAGHYLTIYSDDTALEFAIIREGVLGFSYAIPWLQMSDAQGAISQEAFNAAVAQGARQIMNFYRQHWPDIPTAVLIFAGDLFDAIQKVVSPELTVPIMPFVIGSSAAPSIVPVAFGAALRAGIPEENGQEITFEGVYYEERTIAFFRFWGFMMPAVFIVMCALLASADFLWITHSEANALAAEPNLSSGASDQLDRLIASATAFNQSVAYVAQIEMQKPKGPIITALEGAAQASGVTLSQIIISSPVSPIAISGTASSEDAVVAFKNALTSSTVISSVSLPLSAIQPSSQGGYLFSLTVTLR
jgi:hypothetical protein